MIAFSGLDGAGKSTQIMLVVELYEKRGYKSIVFWGRGGYTPGMKYIKNALNISKEFSKTDGKIRAISREKHFSNFVVRKLWLGLSMLDLILFYSLYIWFKELFGTKVICDRFLCDTLFDFQLNFPQENVENWFLWKLLLLVTVNPAKHFVLTIPVKESQYRSELKKEPFPDSKEVLESRLNKYLKYVAANRNIIHIDGTASIEKIHSEIIQEIKLQ